MEKSRIPLNVEPELREMFEKRLMILNPKITLTQALRNAMFNMIFMNNDELFRFISSGDVNGPVMASYVQLVERAKTDGLLPEDFQLIQPYVDKLNSALTEYYVFDGGPTEKEIKDRLAKLVTQIENSHQFIRRDFKKIWGD